MAEVTFEPLRQAIIAHHPGANTALVEKAFQFADDAHQGQVRRSGEPYIMHPVEVALILANLRMDMASITAGLLHDTVEDTVATLEQLTQMFGEEVAQLVDGVTKLGKIRFRTSEEKQAENFRKMIMAMAQDIRVIIIKLCDRLHNMRTLVHMSAEKQLEIAQETMDIYAPIANRLGMQQLKIELEDLSFSYLKHDIYQMIAQRINDRRGIRDRFIKEVVAMVRAEIDQRGVKADLQGRLKHIYSVHRKMESQNIPFDQIHDLIAFRILVDNIPQCYEVLGVLHSLWKPVPGRFKDYIAMPKQNDYQSLHTTVVGPHGERCEFQIRTFDMHAIAEQGIAAHWRYKEGDRNIASRDEMKFKWVRQLLQWQRELNEPAEFLDTIKLDLFADDIYIFTPQGDLRELPRGSTPIDFAYDVHTDVGNACIGARVNGRMVPLKHVLRSGDTVEILTGKNQRPSKDWLQFVRTSRAKAKIRQYVKAEERVQAIAIGRELLNKVGEQYSVNMAKLLKGNEGERYLQQNNYRELDALFATVGYGKVDPEEVLTAMVPKDQLKAPVVAPAADAKEAGPIKRLVQRVTGRSRSAVKISGITDMLVTFGKCCNPIPGDSIVGFVTRGRGISIHTSDCSRMFSSDPARRVHVTWDEDVRVSRIARVRVSCIDRPGLLANMTEAITNQEVNIVQASVRTLEDQHAVNTFDLDIRDIQQLRRVIQALENVKGVIAVERVRE